MSLPPPSTAQREYVLDLEGPRRRRGQLRLSAMGGMISFDDALRTDLRIPLGTLQFGLVDRGAASSGRVTGRFPILKRLSATAIVPREQGVMLVEGTRQWPLPTFPRDEIARLFEEA